MPAAVSYLTGLYIELWTQLCPPKTHAEALTLMSLSETGSFGSS